MRFSYKWHGRFGWVLAPLLALQALGGAVLLWMQPLPAPQSNPPAVQAWARAVDQGVADLARRYPNAKVEYVNLPREAGAPVGVRLLASASNESGWAEVDPLRGTAGALRPDSSQLKTVLYGLHEHLLLDDAGPWVLRALAIVGLALVAMGLRVWLRVRQLPPRTPWRRVHRVIGPLVVLPIAMMLATGLVLRWPDLTRSLLSSWAAAPPAAVAKPATPAAPAAAPAGVPGATMGQALVTAATALPDSQPLRLYPPRDGVMRVRMRGEEWHPLGLDFVFVNAADASVKRIVRAADQPLTLRYLNFVYSLHTAALPGSAGPAATVAMRVLWTLLALSLAGLALSGAVQRFRASN
jgi:uncharacterized iron-regulated membrane protein